MRASAGAGAERRIRGDTTIDGAEITIQQFKRIGLGYIAQMSLTGPSPFGDRIPLLAPGGVGYLAPRTVWFMFRPSAGGGLVER